MFVICRNGHLVYYWLGNTHIFLEYESGVFPSRKDCLDYLLKQGYTKEKAVSIIQAMQKSPETWLSV